MQDIIMGYCVVCGASKDDCECDTGEDLLENIDEKVDDFVAENLL